MNAQRIMLQLMAKLPGGILRRMGGTPIVIRGAALDPLMQIIWQQGLKQPPIENMTPTEARQGLEAAAATLQAELPQSVAVHEIGIPGPAGDLPTRVYAPRGATQPLPITLFFHFGGFVIGSRYICEGFCGLIAERANTIVLNVDYRLAPEHPFPAPIEDALAAYQWTIEHATELGGDAAHIAVAGDSAGGMLAAVIAQEAKRQGWQKPVCQLLIYPWLVPHSGMASYDDYAEAYPLNSATMAWFGSHYFTAEEQKEHAWSAPLNESDLSGLATAIVITAGYDPLRDEGEAYAKRLNEAGVETTFRCYKSLTHSFSMLGGVAPATQRAMEEIADDLKRKLHA